MLKEVREWLLWVSGIQPGSNHHTWLQPDLLPACFSPGTEPHSLMGSTAKAAVTSPQLPPSFTFFPIMPSYFLSITLGSALFLVGLSFLRNEGVISAFQEPPEFFVLCCVASLIDVRIVKFTHKSQCLWLWGCFELSIECLTHFLLLIRQSVTNIPNCVTLSVLSFCP